MKYFTIITFPNGDIVKGITSSSQKEAFDFAYNKVLNSPQVGEHIIEEIENKS